MIRPIIVMFAVLLADVPPELDPRTGTAAWEWYQTVTLPKAEPGELVMVTLPATVFDKSLDDLSDIRLHDSRGTAVPYALRIRRPQSLQVPATIKRKFNESTQPGHSAELSLELNLNASPEHNEIELALSDSEYRRQVKVEGSDTDGADGWRVLVDKAIVVNYHIDNQRIDVRRVRYPASRHRFVRITVAPDGSKSQDKPAITGATVFMTVHSEGRFVPLAVTLGPREPVRDRGEPGSAWPLEFGGLRVPISNLSVDITDRTFSRPYHLDDLTPDAGVSVWVANGQWDRRARGEVKPLEIALPTDVMVRKLRLVVTDNANTPLTITAIRATTAARELIFARPADGDTLRLYYGNPSAPPPHYDFAANLPAELKPSPPEATLGEPTVNPEYQPPPKPWTERWPGLVYLALGTASAVLLGLLALLARTAIGRHDAATAAASPVG